MKENRTCCICNQKIKGWGNNPDPIPGDECCDKCNNEIVVPIRIFLNCMYKGYLAELTPNNQVGCNYYFKHLYKDFLFLVDEDGDLKHLEKNTIANEMFGLDICGTLLILHRGCWSN